MPSHPSLATPDPPPNGDAVLIGPSAQPLSNGALIVAADPELVKKPTPVSSTQYCMPLCLVSNSVGSSMRARTSKLTALQTLLKIRAYRFVLGIGPKPCALSGLSVAGKNSNQRLRPYTTDSTRYSSFTSALSIVSGLLMSLASATLLDQGVDGDPV